MRTRSFNMDDTVIAFLLPLILSLGDATISLKGVLDHVTLVWAGRQGVNAPDDLIRFEASGIGRAMSGRFTLRSSQGARTQSIILNCIGRMRFEME